MSESKYLRILCSLPVILIALYFFRFWGLIIVFLRYCMYKEKDIFKAPIVLFIVGIIFVLPKLVFNVLNFFKVKVHILDVLVHNDYYSKVLGYGKYLVTMGIIIFVIVFIVKCIIDLINSIEAALKRINETPERSHEIKIIRPREEEPEVIEVEKKHEKHIVECPYCGETVTIDGEFAVCKFCRKKVYYKE